MHTLLLLLGSCLKIVLDQGRISPGEVYKWKARLNVHGGKQEHGVNYWETYAPVIGWTTIRLFLIFRDAQWLGVEAG